MSLMLFIIIVAFFLINKSNKKSSENKRPEQQRSLQKNARPLPNTSKTEQQWSTQKNTIPKQGYSHDGSICSAAKVKKSSLNSVGLEDRENDWLAKQLREEARLKNKMLRE